MMLAAYREAEAQGKVIVGHPFGDLTPPLHGFVHYILFGEEMVGAIGVGYDDFNRYPEPTHLRPSPTLMVLTFQITIGLGCGHVVRLRCFCRNLAA